MEIKIRRGSRPLATALALGILVIALSTAVTITPVPAKGAKKDSDFREGQRMTATRTGNTMRYEFAQPIPHSETRTYDGTRLEDGGCSYVGGGEFPAGSEDSVYVEREIHQDLDRCVMTTESARLTSEEAEQAGYGFSTSTDEGTWAEQSQESEQAIGTFSHNNFSHRGKLKTYYEEPAQADVSTVQANVGWRFNGSCVTAWGTHAYWHWLNDTGWTDVKRWAEWPGGCVRRTAKVYGKFKNGVFCATNDTFTEFNTTRYTGEADGGARWRWSSSKWGGCNWFLSHHAEAWYLGQRQ